MSQLVRVGKTYWQGHQNPSKSVPIFLRGTEANLKMVPIYRVPKSRNRTVTSEFAKSTFSDALLIDEFQNFAADAAGVKSVSVKG